MESNVVLIPISNGCDKLLPACLRFMVSSYCSLFLLAAFNPRRLIRSPLKEGPELSNGRLTSEPKEAVKVGRTWECSRSHYWLHMWLQVTTQNDFIKKGGGYYKDMGSSQGAEGRIELDLESTRRNK